MVLTVGLILILLALVCFLLAAIGGKCRPGESDCGRAIFVAFVNTDRLK